MSERSDYLFLLFALATYACRAGGFWLAFVGDPAARGRISGAAGGDDLCGHRLSMAASRGRRPAAIVALMRCSNDGPRPWPASLSWLVCACSAVASHDCAGPRPHEKSDPADPKLRLEACAFRPYIHCMRHNLRAIAKGTAMYDRTSTLSPAMSLTGGRAFAAFGLWLRVLIAAAGLVAMGLTLLFGGASSVPAIVTFLVGGGLFALLAWRRANAALVRIDRNEATVERAMLKTSCGRRSGAGGGWVEVVSAGWGKRFAIHLLMGVASLDPSYGVTTASLRDHLRVMTGSGVPAYAP
jgi:hypothetical protein